MITNTADTLRIPGQFDSDKLSSQSDLACLDPTLTQAHMADGLDINELVESFMLDPSSNPPYQLPGADLTGLPDNLHDLYNTMQQAYDSLPVHLAQNFTDWRDMAVKMIQDPALVFDKPVPDPVQDPKPDLPPTTSGAAAMPQDGGKTPV